MSRQYPSITPYDNDRLWKLCQTFEIHVPGIGLIRIMGGFVCDFGSVPPWAWPVVGHPLDIPCMTGYLIHDAFYSVKLVSRKTADLALRYLLHEYDAGQIRTATIYSVVRLFGRFPWCHRKASSARAARRYVHLH